MVNRLRIIIIEKNVFAAGYTGHLFWGNIGRKRYSEMILHMIL